jgi:hypothetical protein
VVALFSALNASADPDWDCPEGSLANQDAVMICGIREIPELVKKCRRHAKYFQEKTPRLQWFMLGYSFKKIMYKCNKARGS